MKALSKRERLALTLYASGKTYKEIADSMCVKPKTVDWFMQEIRHKLGLNSRAALMAYAMG